MDGLQGNYRHKMILECDILYKLNIDLCLSNNNIGGNVCVYEGYTDQKKDVLEINVNSSSNYLKEEIFLENRTIGEQTCDGHYMAYRLHIICLL